ncbi:hypothetical protein [Vibrio parahaemolyticus]|nr:hypothetical protein [Vibrio parahaemolyticus]
MEYLAAFWNLENLFAPESSERPEWLKKQIQTDLNGWTEPPLAG